MKTAFPNLYPIARRFCAAVGLEPLPVCPAFPRIVAADLDEDEDEDDFDDTDLEDEDEDDDDEDEWDDDDDMDDDWDDDDIDDCLSHIYTDHGCPVG